MSDLKPKIRFKGFTEPWEQRKLGDVAEISCLDKMSQMKMEMKLVSTYYGNG